VIPPKLLRHLPSLCAEALVVVGAYVAYSALRVLVEGDDTRAFEHALDLVAVEQTLGFFHEAWLQQAVDGQPWLAVALQWIYLHAYLPLLVVSGLVIYMHDRQLYRLYRNTMFISAALGLLIFAALPVAPPRMLPEYGFHDPLHSAFTATSATKNDFAAIPSFHFGFTMLAALGVAHALGFRRWQVAGLSLVPLIMLLSIVATANHYFLDAIVGGLVVMSVWSVMVARAERVEPLAGRRALGERQRL
jgi:uncharacterized membrane protein YhaH (DUF805 family)